MLAAAPPAAPAQVLLVEDDVLVSWSTLQMLEGFGYAVRRARDGKGALRLLLQPGGLAAMIVDVGLPDMNGYQLVRRARTTVPALRVLFTTGYDRTTPGRPPPDTLTAYLEKPYQPAQLEAALRQLLAA